MNIHRPLVLALAISVPFVAFAVDQQNDDNKNVFDKLKDAGFSLKRASSGPEKGEPAELGFLTDIGRQTEFHANFFLPYQPTSTSWGTTEVSPSASIEGKLSSLDASTKDAWRFRLGLQFDVLLGNRITLKDTTAGVLAIATTSKNRLWFTLDAKYESDRDFLTKKIAAQVQVSPTLPDLAVGQTWPKQIAKDPQPPPIQFRWRPFFEIDFGHTYDPGASSEVENTILRLIPRARAELFLNFMKTPLGMRDVSIYADNAFFYLPIESQKTSHNYLVTGITFMINENVGLNFEYKNGEDSPNFVRTHTLGGSLSITF